MPSDSQKPRNSFSLPPLSTSSSGNVHQLHEREIKFHVPTRFHLPENLGIPISPRVFTSTYYDSEQHRLGQLGLTLRKRVEKGQGVWQLKIPSGDYRIELEIDSGSHHIPGQFLELLTGFFRKHEPMQLGKLRTWRTGWLLQKEGKFVAEVVLDSVALLQENKIISRFREMELELKEGKPSHLTFLRKTLQKAGAEPKALQPKIFQALQLPYPIADPQADPTASPSEHIRTKLQAQINQMLIHDPGTRLGRDIEALHQMRVATRRMRAIFRRHASNASDIPLRSHVSRTGMDETDQAGSGMDRFAAGRGERLGCTIGIVKQRIYRHELKGRAGIPAHPEDFSR
jgi:hypothetical protein